MLQHVIDSPIGPLTLVADDAGLREIRFGGDDARQPSQPGAVAHPVLAATVRQLEEYFAGARTEFDLPLAPRGTPFQLAAWEALRAIPHATTVSYGQQARGLGHPAGTARAIGAANGQNPLPIVVPCHRVIGADGRLTGFGGGLETKAWLLDHEQRVAGRQLPF
ncbi:MAG: methylated-DNA--[protein]-cysteine S-methyltransferase [Actinomycetota bacterium]|nr:methylated-DNA--[protein]-cysteine S-methyltransferase [Actinomycetota bacterium]